MSSGGTAKGISQKSLAEVSLLLPKNLKDQEKIADIFSSLNRFITLHQRESEELKRLKKSLLQKMFPKEGALVPELRFPGFTDPWEQRKLGDMGRTYTGLSGKNKNDFGHGKAHYITYMNVFANPVSKLNMTESIEIDNRQTEVEVGDVFFTTSSETPEEVGMSSVLLAKQGVTYLNSFCFGYRPTEKFDGHFLAHMLRSPSVRKKIIFLAQGISRYNISKNKVMELFVGVPSLQEQARIGDFFHRLDTIITLHQRKLETLKKLKKGLLQQMFI